MLWGKTAFVFSTHVKLKSDPFCNAAAQLTALCLAPSSACRVCLPGKILAEFFVTELLFIYVHFEEGQT